ncbi:MAG: DUF4388 domain-containing protein [Polyangiaceae bacterium]
MSRSVVLIDPDLEALGALASALRSRGLSVVVADGWGSAKERIRAGALDAAICAASVQPEPVDIPCLRIGGPSSDPLSVSADPDDVARRLLALPPRRAPVAADKGDFRGDLAKVSLVDLLQLLGMNRRTGALTLTTPVGAGEIRLTEGEITDAAYRRLEGEKALYRLLGEGDGTFAFSSGAPSALRRIEQPLNNLLMEGLRQHDEVKRACRELCGEGDAVLATATPEDDDPDVQRAILLCSQSPRSLEEVLDEVPALDLDIVKAIAELLAARRVRTIASGAERVPFAGGEQAALVSAMAARLVSIGFEGGARLVIAGSSSQLAAAAHAMRRIVEASPLADGTPAAPVPHVLATLKLSEGADLEIVGLPLLKAFAPLWPMSIAGAAGAITLEAGPQPELEEACGAAGVPLEQAGQGLDAADPSQLATMMRQALDAASGRK